MFFIFLFFFVREFPFFKLSITPSYEDVMKGCDTELNTQSLSAYLPSSHDVLRQTAVMDEVGN